MLFRDYTLEYRRGFATFAHTFIRDIDIKDPISEILIKVEAWNGPAGNDENPLPLNVTKIELTDGGTTLWSMDGEQCVVAARATRGNLPPEYRSEWDNVEVYQVFPLHFGRWYGDTEYAFDPTRFKNPQLKITWNLETVRTIAGALGYAVDPVGAVNYVTISIVARIMEGAPAPNKMFVVKQVSNWTGATTGVRRIELPVDWPYRCLIVRSFLTNCPPRANITNLKMSCDADKFVPFDLPAEEMIRQEYSQYEMVHRVQELLVNEAEVKDTHLGDCHEVVVCSGTHETFFASRIWNEVSATIMNYSAVMTLYAVNCGCSLYSKGYQAEFAFLIPFGNKDTPEQWFPTKDYGDIELLLTEAAAAVNSVALQQVMPY